MVAFEADSVDAAGHGGWSVTVVGYAMAVTDRAEIARLEQLPLTPWAPGNRDHFIRVSPAIVNGGRIGAGQAQGTGDLLPRQAVAADEGGQVGEAGRVAPFVVVPAEYLD